MKLAAGAVVLVLLTGCADEPIPPPGPAVLTDPQEILSNPISKFRWDSGKETGRLAFAVEFEVPRPSACFFQLSLFAKPEDYGVTAAGVLGFAEGFGSLAYGAYENLRLSALGVEHDDGETPDVPKGKVTISQLVPEFQGRVQISLVHVNAQLNPILDALVVNSNCDGEMLVRSVHSGRHVVIGSKDETGGAIDARVPVDNGPIEAIETSAQRTMRFSADLPLVRFFGVSTPAMGTASLNSPSGRQEWNLETAQRFLADYGPGEFEFGFTRAAKVENNQPSRLWWTFAELEPNVRFGNLTATKHTS